MEEIKEKFNGLVKTFGDYDSAFDRRCYVLDVFCACSDGAAELGDSTIDEIRVYGDGTVMFYYNANTNDCAELESFDRDDLEQFYKDLYEYFDEIEMYDGEYDDDYLQANGLEIVTWPDIQYYMEKPGFRANSALINDDYGLDTYGSSAYVINKEWLER